MTKIKIDGKEVNAEICNSVAVFKAKGWRARHFHTGLLLGGDRVFETKEQAIRWAWAMQERLKLNVKSRSDFKEQNKDLTYEAACAIAEEEFGRAKI